MAEERSLVERISLVTGLIAAVASVFGALTQVFSGIEAVIPAAKKVPPSGWWTLSGVLLVLAILSLRAGLAKRSRVGNPQMLVLRADRAEHLQGRSEEVDTLVQRCLARTQVNVVGESGAGKSALLQSGVVPALQALPAAFPIYIDSWGRDWSDGPRRAVLDFVAQALNPDDRQKAGFGETANDSSITTVMRGMYRKLGRRPILIFDQLDDYQVQHYDRFVMPGQRTLLPTSELIAANSFWRDMSTLVEEDTVHCVFVTRADAAAGLESVRLTSPTVFSLDRLRPAHVLPLLDHLASSGGVVNPDHGWNHLKVRISRDLAATGSVLPAQMKLALKGLIGLRYLTVAEYERHGGLQGLEAADVEWHIASAQRSFDLAPREARAVLISMVDAATQKTRAWCTLDELIDAAASASARSRDSIAPIVARVLDEWEMRELVRKRIDADTGETVWSLDHDYLCRGVLAADRRGDRWRMLLRESHEDFDAAGGDFWRRWRMMLPVTTQFQLGWQALRRRLDYGLHAGYAAISLLRFVPIVVIAAIAVFAIDRVLNERVDARARQILDRFTGSNAMSQDERQALRELAAVDDKEVAYSVVRQMIESAAVKRVRRRIPEIVQAAAGLDLALRKQIADEVLGPCFERKDADLDSMTPCIRTGFALALDEPRMIAAYERYLSELARSRRNVMLETPSMSWGRFLRGATAEQKKSIITTYIELGRAEPNEVMTACHELRVEDCRALIKKNLVNLAPEQPNLDRWTAAVETDPVLSAVIRQRQSAWAREIRVPATSDERASELFAAIRAEDGKVLDVATQTRLFNYAFTGDVESGSATLAILEGVETNQDHCDQVLAYVKDSFVDLEETDLFKTFARLRAHDRPKVTASLLTMIRTADDHNTQHFAALALTAMKPGPVILNRTFEVLLGRNDINLDAINTVAAATRQTSRVAPFACRAFGTETDDASRALMISRFAELGVNWNECPAVATAVSNAVRRPARHAQQPDDSSERPLLLQAAAKAGVRVDLGDPSDLLRRMETPNDPDAILAAYAVWRFVPSLTAVERTRIVRAAVRIAGDKHFKRHALATEMLDQIPEPVPQVELVSLAEKFLTLSWRTTWVRNLLLETLERLENPGRDRILDKIADAIQPRDISRISAAIQLIEPYGFGRLNTQALLNLLKTPDCTSRCETDVKRVLERQAGKKFETDWEIAQWASARYDVMTRPQLAAITPAHSSPSFIGDDE